MPDASQFWPCWVIAQSVSRMRDLEWHCPPWRWLCSDIARDRPREEAHA